jgi:hypothetical protein
MEFYDFPETVGNFIIPSDFKSIIFRGRLKTTNQPMFCRSTSPTTHEINEKPDLSPSFCGQNPWFPDGFPRQNGAH